MSDEPIEPIDPELRALLDAEGKAPPVGGLERVWSRLVVVAPSGSIDRGGSGSGASSGGFGAQVGLVGAVAFVVGGVAGAGLLAAVRPQPPAHIVYVEHAAPPPSVGAPVPVPSAPAPNEASRPDAPAPTKPIATATASAPSAGSMQSSLARERTLLDAARAALTSGKPEEALLLAHDHARSFATPQLGEEREALAIQALVAAGRYEEARARAARFRASAPDSLFMPAVDATLRSIP